MANIFKRLLQLFRYGSTLTRLIFINAGVFLTLRIIAVICHLGNIPDWQHAILKYVELPSRPELLAMRPWTILTYMFAQFDVLHIMFNMLWLYWFGAIFLSINTQKRLLALYLFGGIGGGLVYFLAYNTLPALIGINAGLIGASAAVIAIVVATAIMMPDYKVPLLFLGPVSLKWIAIATLAIDFLSITGQNGGGHISHIGGALTGAAFALAMRNGVDITAPFNRLIDKIVNLCRRLKAGSNPLRAKKSAKQSRPTAHAGSVSDQKTLDEILDKIKKSGYTSLTPGERKTLFDVSSRIKQE